MIMNKQFKYGLIFIRIINFEKEHIWHMWQESNRKLK